MEIIWSARANKEWKSIAVYIFNEFGKKTATDFLNQTKLWERKLLLFPECGMPEPLLASKQIHYRSVIFSKYNKLIYYIKGDTIRIADVWDMRRSPQVLARRIHTK